MYEVEDNPQAKPRRKKSLNKHNSSSNGEESPDSRVQAPGLEGLEGEAPGYLKPPRRDHAYTFDIECGNGRPGIGVALGVKDMGMFSKEVKGRDEVYSRKENGQFFYVSSLEDSSTRDCGLRVGDEILVINAYKLDTVSSVFAVETILEQSWRSGRVRISVARPRLSTSMQNLSELITPLEVPEESDVNHNISPPPSPSEQLEYNQESNTMNDEFSQFMSSTYEIELQKEEGGKPLGIGIVGGVDAPMGAIGIFVKSIYPGGLAGEDGRICVGDELLAVNGEILHGLKHSEAVQILKSLEPGAISIIIRRDDQQIISLSPTHKAVDQAVRSPLSSMSEEISAPPRRKKSNPSTPTIHSSTSPLLLEKQNSLSGINEENHFNSDTDQRMDIAAPSHFNGDSTTRTSDMLNKINNSSIMNGKVESFEAKTLPTESVLHGGKKAGLSNGNNTWNGNRSDTGISQSEENVQDYSKFILPSPPEFKSATTPVSTFPHGDEEKLDLSGSNEFLNEPPEGFEPPMDFEPPKDFEPPVDFDGFEPPPPPPVCNESFEDNICPPEEFVENILPTATAGISDNQKHDMKGNDKAAKESKIDHEESYDLQVNMNGIDEDLNVGEKQNFENSPDDFDIPPESEISTNKMEESDDELPPPPPPSSLPPPLPTSEIPELIEEKLGDFISTDKETDNFTSVNENLDQLKLKSSNYLSGKAEEREEEHLTEKDFDDSNLSSTQNESAPSNETHLIPPPILSFNNLPDKTSLSLSEPSNPIFDEEIEAASGSKPTSEERNLDKPVINKMKPTTQPKPHVSYKPKKKIKENDVTETKNIVENDSNKDTGCKASSNRSTDVEKENDVVSMDASTSNEVFVETNKESSTSISTAEDVVTATDHSKTDIINTDDASSKNILEFNKKDCEAENTEKQDSTKASTVDNANESRSLGEKMQNALKVTDSKPVLEKSSISPTVSTTSAEASTITRTPSEGKEFSSYLSLMQRSAFRSPFQSQNNTVKSFKVPSIPSTKPPVESADNDLQNESRQVEKTVNNDKEQKNEVISSNNEATVESQLNSKEKVSDVDLPPPPIPNFNEHHSDQDFESNFPPPPIPSSSPPSLPFSPPPDFQSPPVCADPPTPFASSSSLSSPFQSTVSKLHSVKPIKAELKTYEPIQNDTDREEKKTEENKLSSQKSVVTSLLSEPVNLSEDIQESRLTNSSVVIEKPNKTNSKNSDVLDTLNSPDTINLQPPANTDLKINQPSIQLHETDLEKISRNDDDVNKGVSLDDTLPNSKTNTILTDNSNITTKSPLKSSESVTEEANDAFSKSKRTMSKDEMISNVLKDYYTMEDPAPAPVVEEKKKPVKPLIAQALLPKSKRNQPITATLLSSSNSAQNTVPSTGKDSLVDHSSTTNTPTISTSEFPADDLRKHSTESGLKSENDRKSFTRLSNARYSDVFEPDSFTVSKNQSISSDSKSYLLSKYLEEQADQSNQSDIVSSKDSVCSASDNSDRMSEVESVDYKANVANSSAFYEALDKKRTSNSKSASVGAAFSNRDKADVADGDKIQSEKQPAAPNKIVNNDEMAKNVNQKEQFSVLNTDVPSAKEKPGSDDNEAENVISVSAGRNLFEGKTNKASNTTNQIQINNTSEDVTSDSASLISSSSSDNKGVPSLSNNNQPIAESNQKSEASEPIVRKPSITSSTIQQRAMKFPQSFGIRGFSDADITKVKEIAEMKSMETFPSVIKMKETEQKSDSDKNINEEIERKTMETAYSDIKQKEINQGSEPDSSTKEENGTEVNVKEQEQEKINIKDSRAFFKSLSDKSDKNLPNKNAHDLPTVEQKPVVNMNAEDYVKNKVDSSNTCTENSKNINISINANNNSTKNSTTSSLVNNEHKSKANDSGDKPISNGNVKNIADKIVADKNMVDKSIADKSIVDKGIAEKSIVNTNETKRNFITSAKSVDESPNRRLSTTRDTIAINSSNGVTTPVNNNLNTNTSISKDLKSPIANKSEAFLRNNESNLNNRVSTNMGNGSVAAPGGPEASRPLQRNQRSASLQPTIGGVVKKPPPTAPKSDSTRSGNQENTKSFTSGSQINKIESTKEEEESISMEAIFDKFKKISAPTKGDNDSAKKSEDDTTQSGRGRNFSIPAQKSSILPSPLLNKDKDSNLNRGRRSVQIFNTAEKE